MKNNVFYAFCLFATFILTQCGGGGGNPGGVVTNPPSTLTINLPNPLPDVLAAYSQDLTPSLALGQPITIPTGHSQSSVGTCILAIYGQTGTYNAGNAIVPTYGGGTNIPPPPQVTAFYNIDPANTRPIPLSFGNGTTTTPLVRQTSSLTGRSMEISYAGHPVASWRNEPPTGPFATQPIPNPQTNVLFTVRDNLAATRRILHPELVTVNVSAGNIVVSMKPDALTCQGQDRNSHLNQAEVHIAHQKFGTPMSPYQPVPNSLVSVNSNGELQATIALPQSTMSALSGSNGRPAPGFYYIRLRLHDGNTTNMVAEILPAFVVWNL